MAKQITKRMIFRKVISPLHFIFVSIALVILLAVVVIDRQTTAIVVVSILLVIPAFYFLLRAIYMAIEKVNFIEEQEKFYQISFDEEMSNFSLEEGRTEYGLWYLDLERTGTLVFRKGIILRFEDYEKQVKIVRSYMTIELELEFVTITCHIGNKIKLEDESFPRISNLMKWVEES